QIIATAPPQVAGTVHLTVSSYAGTSATSSSDQFTYSSAGTPAITSINGSGTIAGGDNVAILGSGFTGASAVLFGKVPAAYFTVLSDNAIIATTPALMAGTWHITVTTLTGTSTTSSPDQFT